MMENGKQKVTVVDIAREAGVSNATVSRVLNNQDLVKDETLKKVLAAMQRLGLDVDKVLASGEPGGKVLLFNIPFTLNSFFNEVARGAKTSAAQHGYQLLIYQELIDHDNFRSLEKLIRGIRVSGIITINRIEASLLRRLSGIVPVVQCSEYDPGIEDIASVSIDDYKATTSAMNYILSLGRRRIGFVTMPLTFFNARARRQAYLDALQKAGIEPLDSYLVHLPDVDFNMAFSATKQLLSQPQPPDAVFTMADVYGAAVVRAATEMGFSVPGQLAVVGFDNTDYSTIPSPALTTVNQPKFQLGYMAGELLVEKAQNPAAAAQHIVLDTELVIREST